MPDRDHITRTLLDLRPDEDALEIQNRLFDQVYAELREMAAGFMRRERPDHTLQPTDLIHEAYLRLVDHERVPWEGRAHFFGAAARAMRRILVEHARKKLAAKRGSRQPMVTLNEDLVSRGSPEMELIALDDLLTTLSALDDRMSRVVELRVFAGLTSKELAHVLGVSIRTVDGDWAMAKRWLRHKLA